MKPKVIKALIVVAFISHIIVWLGTYAYYQQTSSIWHEQALTNSCHTACVQLMIFSICLIGHNIDT